MEDIELEPGEHRVLITQMEERDSVNVCLGVFCCSTAVSVTVILICLVYQFT